MSNPARIALDILRVDRSILTFFSSIPKNDVDQLLDCIQACAAFCNDLNMLGSDWADKSHALMEIARKINRRRLPNLRLRYRSIPRRQFVYLLNDIARQYNRRIIVPWEAAVGSPQGRSGLRPMLEMEYLVADRILLLSSARTVQRALKWRLVGTTKIDSAARRDLLGKMTAVVEALEIRPDDKDHLEAMAFDFARAFLTVQREVLVKDPSLHDAIAAFMGQLGHYLSREKSFLDPPKAIAAGAAAPA